MKCGVVAVFWMAIVLAGCGGGGGGGGSGSPSVANQADGLGDAGHAAGTLDIGQTEPTVASNSSSFSGPEAIAVALSEQSRALVVWRMSDLAPNGKTLLWSQETGNGGWSSPQPVPQATSSARGHWSASRSPRSSGGSGRGCSTARPAASA